MTNSKSEPIHYNCDGVDCHGLAVFPQDMSQPRPVVLIAHTWAGRNDFIDAVASDMAAKGYIGFALDLYGGHQQGKDTDSCAALMQPLMDDRKLLQRRMLAGLEAVSRIEGADSETIAAIGYCFGGLCVQDLARVSSRPAGIVSIHGLMTPADQMLTDKAAWQSRVLLLHGAKDPMVSAEDWQALRSEMDAVDCDWQKHDFGQALHAFTNPNANDHDMGTVYHPRAARRTDFLLADFLHELFA